MTLSIPRTPSLGGQHNQIGGDGPAIALRALGWTLADADRARRLLDLTGLSPDALRARLGDRALLAATIAFLEAHEADLIACAAAIEVTPATLVAAREALER